jgi:hypothetical protein
MNLARFQEQIFFTTVRITISGHDGASESIGTGFLFNTPIGDANNSSALLLISNRHVYQNPERRIRVSFHQLKNDNSGPNLGAVVNIQSDGFRGIYVEHPDPDVDLACINVSEITKPEHRVFFRSLHPDIVATFQEGDLMPGASVWFIGYPENRFDSAHNLPILRCGHIASMPTVDFLGRKQFVIDGQVFPGSSGSPVFAEIGSMYRFAGVITQTMIRNQELQAIPTRAAVGVEQVLGLGIVLKAPLVTELVDRVTRQIREALATRAEPVQAAAPAPVPGQPAPGDTVA